MMSQTCSIVKLLGGLSLGVVFLVSGLTINLLQLLAYVLVRPWAPALHRRLNYFLLYSSWAQLVNVAQWWSGSKVRLHTDEETLRHFCKEPTLSLMNHRYEVDWLMCFLCMDYFKNLGNSRSFIKQELKRVPVIGWGWACSDFIFVRRSWEQDAKNLGNQLDTLLSYGDPFNLLMFCEGTRLTPEKFEASMAFAKQRGLPPLNYHLIPRTRGFNFCARYLKDKMAAVYDLQLCFPPEGPAPTFLNVLLGKPLVGDLYVRRIPMSEVPTDSEEASTKWLMELYQHKDKLMEEYQRTREFPTEKKVNLTRRAAPLVNTLAWAGVIGAGLMYLLAWLVQNGHYTPLGLLLLALLFGKSSSKSSGLNYRVLQ
ncbi:AGPAT3 [Cordylochernes scorpioides]|uniref:AGPAT3 n=1 Tax=Cordylochernes scorpioides TaxID=51811 RepID=A0ABY6JY29_9ARAC|nr:AGPAT3 [Cordylochernes scorpioides]